jgi:hypothetical protein
VSRWLLALVCVGALALAGCGGGDDSAPSSSTSEATTAATQAEAKSTASQDAKGSDGDRSSSKGKQGKGSTEKAKGNGSHAKGNRSSSHPKPPKPVAPPRISSRPVAGSKHPAPGVKTVKGGDNSVQEYGVEAGESERTEASIALATYLNARAEGNWSAVCSLLAKRPTEQLEKLSGNKADCAEVMKETAKGTPSMPGSTITEVLSFRGEGEISGNPSYLIFTGPPGATLFSMPMYLQGGTWKVGLAQPSELPV